MPQAPGLELETDNEQQQRDADLGDTGDLFRILDQAKELRADQCARDDVPKRRAELQAAEQGHKDERSAKHDRAAFEDRGCCLGSFGGRGHCDDSIAASNARNGSRIAPWRALRGRAGASAATPGQPLSSCSPASQRLSVSIARDTSSCVQPRLCRSTNAADAWPKAQA